MALIEMDFAGSGSEHYEETLLWTNPSPTSDFADQTITLANDITNYDFLKLLWIYNKSTITSGSNLYSELIPVSKLISSGVYDTQNVSRYLFGARVGQTHKGRAIVYATSTSVRITANWNLNSSGTDNASCIPYQIIGVKKVGGSSSIKKITDYLANIDYDSDNQSFNANATKEFTTTHRLKQAIFYCLRWDASIPSIVHFIDFEKQVIYTMENPSGVQNIHDGTSNYSNIVTNITDSSVTLKNYSSTSRTWRLMGWYE